MLGTVHAQHAEVSAAIAALEHSAEILRGTTERQELARTLAALGRLYRELPKHDRRKVQSDQLLSEARTIFKELGAALDLRRLEEPAATH